MVFDPSDGKSRVVTQEPALGFNLPADGAGVYHWGQSGASYVPLDGAPVRLAEGAAQGVNALFGNGNYLAFVNQGALYLAEHARTPVRIPSTDGSTSGLVAGYSRGFRRMLLAVRRSDRTVEDLLYWVVGEPTARNLRNADNESLGPIAGRHHVLF
jgi:hypothetical protein